MSTVCLHLSKNEVRVGIWGVIFLGRLTDFAWLGGWVGFVFVYPHDGVEDVVYSSPLQQPGRPTTQPPSTASARRTRTTKCWWVGWATGEWIPDHKVLFVWNDSQTSSAPSEIFRRKSSFIFLEELYSGVQNLFVSSVSKPVKSFLTLTWFYRKYFIPSFLYSSSVFSLRSLFPFFLFFPFSYF